MSSKITSRVERIFWKKTKGGRLVKVVREHYLRNDITCGFSRCSSCQTIAASFPDKNERRRALPLKVALSDTVIVLDTNVVLHQIDLLEHHAFENVIVPQTVLEEVQHRNLHNYSRLREILADAKRTFFVFNNEHLAETYVGDRRDNETPNDRNDRAIRVATRWLSAHLRETHDDTASQSLLLLTNDRACLQLALNEGIDARTVHDYAVELSKAGHPELVDIVVPESDAEGNGDERKSAADGSLFPSHLTAEQVASGVREGRLVRGTLRVSMYNNKEGFVDIKQDEAFGKIALIKGTSANLLMGGEFEGGVLVQGVLALNRAVDGDIVAIELMPEEDWVAPSNLLLTDNEPAVEPAENAEEDENVVTQPMQLDDEHAVTASNVVHARKRPTARVVGIVRRNWRSCVGIVLPPPDGVLASSLHYAIFQPRDRRLPRVRLRTQQFASLAKQCVQVAIDGWSRFSRYPNGHFVKLLGENADDPATQTEALLIQHDIPTHPFSEAAMKCVPKQPWTVEGSEDVASLKKRLDLRTARSIVSVDPPGCTDIDDALHVVELGNGEFEVGVHIADVTHFVEEGSALDEEALRRGTTVYLVDRRIDMLPSALSTDICSLVPGVDRLTFSCVWRLRLPQDEQSEVEVLETSFYKAIIRSKAALTYEQAQKAIDDHESGAAISDLGRDLSTLLAIARRLRRTRFQRGALTLANTEVRFLRRSEETQDPTDVELYKMRETNYMVEEFMLLANVSTAKKITEMFPAHAMLRRHPIPDEHAFDGLVQSAHNVGIVIDPQSSLTLSRSLDAAKLEGNPFFSTLLRIMTTRCMTQALNFSSGTVPRDEYYHYGLASTIYTHFTSPIRRYTDGVVHRLLAAAIGWKTLSTHVNRDSVRRIADSINRRQRAAQQAARDSTAMYTLMFFKGRRVVEDAYIMRVRANGFVCLIPRYGVEGVVYVSERSSSNPFVFDEKAQSLTHQSGNGPKFTVFSKVRVCVFVDETVSYDKKLCIVCVDPAVGKGLLVAKELQRAKKRKK